MEQRPSRIASFGQYMRGYVTKRKENMQRSGGGGIGIRINNKFSPPDDHTAKIRLVPGEYKVFDGTTQPFFQYVQMYCVRTKRSFVSSKQFAIDEDGALKAVGGRCLGWDIYERESAERLPKDERSVSFRLLHTFTAIHLAYFHLVTIEDDHGRPLKYEKGARKGEVMKEKVLCDGRRCVHCQNKVDRVFGKKVYWSLGQRFMELLTGTIVEIAKDCRSCGKGRLNNIGWECPECGKLIVDESNPKLTDVEINAVTCNPYRCDCGFHGFLERIAECDTCQDPKPTSVFDVDLEVKRVGEAPSTIIQIPRWTVTELTDELKKMSSPYPFENIFAPEPLDGQARSLKISNPYKEEQADKFSRSYDQPEESTADSPDFDR